MRADRLDILVTFVNCLRRVSARIILAEFHITDTASHALYSK